MKLENFSESELVLHTIEGVSEKRIRQVEESLQVRFPEDYYNFMRKCNGAVLNLPVIWSEDLKRWVFIEVLWSISAEENSDNGIKSGLEYMNYLSAAYCNNQISNGWFAFGGGEGNEFLMNTSTGEVYTWNISETYSLGEDGNVYKVANSFTEFLENLEEYDLFTHLHFD